MDSDLMYCTLGVTTPIEIESYPNGDPLVRWDGLTPDRVLLRPRSITTFMAALWWVDALVARGRRVPPLILPVMPGMRQDRINDEGDYLFTAKSVAEEINRRNFPVVLLLDPHSSVTPALLERSRLVDVAVRFSPDTLPNGRYDGVISPDAGAEKRAGFWAKHLNIPLFRAWKARNLATGAISGFGIEQIKPGHYLVVDDICDGGGTFLGLGGLLKDNGATADLFTTHGYYSKGTDELAKRFNRIICTDSVIGDKGCATVLPVCADLLRSNLV